MRIDSLKEFERVLYVEGRRAAEIHGGLAYCHFVESPEMDEKLKALKVTVRCVPLNGRERTGQVYLHRAAERATRGVCEVVLGWPRKAQKGTKECESLSHDCDLSSCSLCFCG